MACFRCNGKLWKTFKSTVKAQGLSICHVLEPMILGWLQGYVYVSNTIKPIKIENVVIERAVKRVRRYAVEEFVVCEARGCREPAEFRFYHYNGNVYNLCGKHVEEYREFAVKVEPLGSGDSE